LSLFLLFVSLLLGIRAAVVWRRIGHPSNACATLAALLLCLCIGDLLFPPDWAFWLSVVSLAGIFVMVIVLIITGGWSAYFGCSLGVLLFLGIGGMVLSPLSRGLVEAGKVMAGLEATRPWWLLLLLFVPVVVLWSYRSLAGLGPVRRWIAIGLRCALVMLLSLALAEVR